MKSASAARLLDVLGLRGPLSAALPPRGVLVLNYHRIGDWNTSPHDRELWSASVEAFATQVAFVAKNCDVILPGQLTDALGQRGGRHVLITFDDGYRDNFELAYPILRGHGVPATFFISTGFIDDPALPWWDEIAGIVRGTDSRHLRMEGLRGALVPPNEGTRSGLIRSLLRHYKSLPADEALAFLEQMRLEAGAPVAGTSATHWMTWDMLREMHRGGMTIGGHTVNHPILSRVSRDRQREEISGCAARILEEIGTPMEYFAYPVGGRDSFDRDTMELLREQGVRYAFSYYGGFVTRTVNPYDVPRVAVERHTSPALFRAMVQLPQIFCRRPYTSADGAGA